jgi:predicted phosphodiesterase
VRIAVVADIHGNGTAFEAVLADLRQTSPDLILHGGDLADGGSSPVEIVDRIRDLGWQGVAGNTDEMLSAPDSLEEFASQHLALQPLWAALREMAAATREVLGQERLTWLRALPAVQRHGELALVHASPESPWRAPAHTASDAVLESVYSPLAIANKIGAIAVYGHIHQPFLRNLPRMIVANTGSVGLSYDGDRRAAYLLLDDSTPAIRRVEYDVDREIKALRACGIPHADWTAKMIESASPQMP